MELPGDLKIEFNEQITRYQEEKRMPFIDTFEEIGMERGLGKGRLEDIETILELRFPAACNQLMSEIRQIHDHQELKKIHRTALTAASPDELRRLWADRADSHPIRPARTVGPRWESRQMRHGASTGHGGLCQSTSRGFCEQRRLRRANLGPGLTPIDSTNRSSRYSLDGMHRVLSGGEKLSGTVALLSHSSHSRLSLTVPGRVALGGPGLPQIRTWTH